MDRRKALKNIGLATGFMVATPSMISLLQGCKSGSEKWVPAFLNTDEEVFVNNFVDILLPKTEGLPGASDLNVTQFLDTFMKEVLAPEEQKLFRGTLSEMISELKGEAKDLNEKTPDDFKSIIDKYMLVKGEIDEERKANPRPPYNEANAISGNFVYTKPTKNEALNHLKWLTISAYRWNEQIGENVMPYDPIPATYECGDLQELTGGKAWSI